jgi:aspartate aminotransferase
MTTMATTAPPTSTGKISDRLRRIEPSLTLTIVAEGAKLKAQGIDLVDFGAGEPHFPTPRHIKDAAIEAINKDFTKYTNVAGIPPLREAIVKRHATDFGSDYTSNECTVSTGGKLALFEAIQVVVDHGDEVIVPVPYWVSFKDIVQYAAGTPVYVECEEKTNFKLTPKMVERAITPRTRAIIINVPNNPSGAVLAEDEFRQIAQIAYDRGIYLICDECYVYFNYAHAPFSAGGFTEFKDRTIVIGSFSKTYSMTGWRMGYSLAPQAVATEIQKLQSQATSSSAAMVQKAALAAVTGPQDCVGEFKAEYMKLRDIAVKGLCDIPGLSCTKPDGAFYVYPNVTKFFGKSGIKSAADVSRRLLHEAHVVTVPGEGFGTQEHIRLSYAVREEDLRRGLQRMKDWFGKISG